jgi:hypothetical protein
MTDGRGGKGEEEARWLGDQMQLISVICAGILGQSIYRCLEPSRNRVVVPARQAILAGGIDSFVSIPWNRFVGFLKV